MDNKYRVSLWEGGNKSIDFSTNTLTISAFKPYEQKLTLKENGQHEFSFLIQMWARAHEGEELQENPIANLLQNESEIHVEWKDKTYLFLIKEIEETNKKYERTIKCQALLPQLLSRNGYNVELNGDLGTSLGTAPELAHRILYDAPNFVYDEENSDKLYGTLREPLLWGTTQTQLRAHGLEDNAKTIEVPVGASFFIFLKNKDNTKKGFQFICNLNNTKPTDYSIDSDLTISQETVWVAENDITFTSDNIVDYQGYFGNYYTQNQVSHYEPRLSMMVQKYTNGYWGIPYRLYNATSFVENFVPNHSNFQLITHKEGLKEYGYTIQNWQARNTAKLYHGIYPSYQSISASTSEISTYLCVDFNAQYDSIINTKLSSTDNTTLRAGSDMVVRALVSGCASSSNFVHEGMSVVPKAGKFGITRDKLKFEIFNSNGEIVAQSTSAQLNKIEFMPVDGVVGVTDPQDKGWYTKTNNTFQLATDTQCKPNVQYYEHILEGTMGEEWGSYPLEVIKDFEINDSILKISSIFNGSWTLILKDIELSRLYRNKSQDILFSGAQVPSDIENVTAFFKEEENLDITDVKKLKVAPLSQTANLKPIYYDYDAIHSLQGEKSSYYNWLQILTEAFQCRLEIEPNIVNGALIPKTFAYMSADLTFVAGKQYYKDKDCTIPYVGTKGNPMSLGLYEQKSGCYLVRLKRPKSNVNYAGFHYGLNLDSIIRTLNSDKITTKMVVLDCEVEGANHGICTIREAKDNPSGLTTLYDFSYFVNKGDIKRSDLITDLYSDVSGIGFYKLTREYNTQLALLNAQKADLGALVVKLKADETVQLNYSKAANVSFDKAYQNLYDFCWNFLDPKPTTNIDTAIINFAKQYSKLGVKFNQADVLLQIFLNAKIARDKSAQDYEETHTQLTIARSRLEQVEQNIEELNKKKQDIYNRFTTKYSKYIYEGTHSSNNVVDPNIYYYNAMNVMKASCKPTVSYSIEVVDIEQLKGFEEYRFQVGDKTFVTDVNLFGRNGNGSPYREEIIITEITYNLDNPTEVKIVVQNYRDSFDDLFHRVEATVQNVEAKGNAYARAGSIVQPDGKIAPSSVQKTFDTGNITLSYGDLKLGAQGIQTHNNQLGAQLRLMGRGLYGTQDGINWTEIIKGNGVNASTLQIGNINTANVSILNENQPTFQWASNGITAYAFQPTEFELVNNTSGKSPKAENWYELNEHHILVPSADTQPDTFSRVDNALLVTQYGNAFSPAQYNLYERAGNTYQPATGTFNNTKTYYKQDNKLYFKRKDGSYMKTKKGQFVRLDQFGLYGLNTNMVDGADYSPSTLEQIEQDAQFGLTWNGFFLNGEESKVRLDSKKGLTLDYNNSSIVLGKIDDDKYGLRIDGDHGKFLEARAGNITLNGDIKATSLEIVPVTAFSLVIDTEPIRLRAGADASGDNYELPIKVFNGMKPYKGTLTYKFIDKQKLYEKSNTISLINGEFTIENLSKIAYDYGGDLTVTI